jgi:hypothetical protein
MSIVNPPAGVGGALSASRPLSATQARAGLDLRRFALLAGQLALLLVVFRIFNVESSAFFRLGCATFAAFVIHYFVPFAWKKQAFLALSIAGAAYVLWPEDPRRRTVDSALNVASIILATLILALLFFAILRLSIAFRWRAALLLVCGAGLWIARDLGLVFPNVYWAIIGSIFMFRLILFAYEVRNARTPETLTDYLGYMFLLPNFYFPLFPVVDYSTFKRSHYAEDIHVVAQRGILWITRGTIQLLLLNLVRHNLQIAAGEVHDLPSLLQFIFSAYLMYLRVSGHFHIAVGMLLLFGYALPETHRKYFLAHSFMDFWRRINIYWKDFMVKMVFYPVHFRLRKRSEMAGMIVGTLCVFAATTVLHSYQFFWINGQFDLTLSDVLFWGILGCVVLMNMLVEQRAAKKKKKKAALGRAPVDAPGIGFWLRRGLQIAAMYVTISILWSMWSTRELSIWFETLAAGFGGTQ